MRKQIILTLLMLALALALVGCGTTATPTTSEPAAPAPTDASAEAPADTASEQATSEEADEEAGASSSDGRTAQFPQPLIVYQQAAHNPDGPQQWTIYPTGLIESASGEQTMLAPEIVAPVFDLVATDDFQRLNAHYELGECQDCITHTITVYGEGEPQEIVVVDGGGELPAPLEEAIGALSLLVTQ